jgi:hypothetical protein
MNSIATTVVSLYESEGLDIRTIAAAEGLEEITVKAVLLQHSAKYKAELKVLDSLVKTGSLPTPGPRDDSRDEVQDNPLLGLISREEITEFVGIYKEIARYSENDAVRERACKNLINLGADVTDGLGENNAKKLMKEALKAGKGSINILVLEQHLQAAKQAKQGVLEDKTAFPMLQAVEA